MIRTNDKNNKPFFIHPHVLNGEEAKLLFPSHNIFPLGNDATAKGIVAANIALSAKVLILMLDGNSFPQLKVYCGRSPVQEGHVLNQNCPKLRVKPGQETTCRTMTCSKQSMPNVSSSRIETARIASSLSEQCGTIGRSRVRSLMIAAFRNVFGVPIAFKHQLGSRWKWPKQKNMRRAQTKQMKNSNIFQDRAFPSSLHFSSKVAFHLVPRCVALDLDSLGTSLPSSLGTKHPNILSGQHLKAIASSIAFSVSQCRPATIHALCLD